MEFFEWNETKLYYEMEGEGTPVLLIHGWGIDHHYMTGCMEPVFQQVDKNYQRFYIDLPGMGKSLPGKVMNGDDIVSVLIAFIKQKMKGKAVILVGNSFGGLLSCAIARKEAELVSGMILIAPSTGRVERKLPDRKECRKYGERMDEDFLKSLSKEEQDCFRAMNARLTKEAWEQYKKFIYPTVLESEKNDFLNHKLDGSVRYDLYQNREDEMFVKPVLFLTGKQDTNVGYEDQFELAKQYPASTYVAINGASHNVPFDQPGMFEMIVSSWMKEI